MKQKRARYIQRNNEIIQEFYFAHPETKCHLNNIYNMSFYGSPLWDLFSDTFSNIEFTYNRSIKMMWDLPLETHKYFIEPVSNQSHVKFNIFKRYIGFKDQVFKSKKNVLKHLYSICMKDTNSVTGKNLRKIMFCCDLNSISDLNCDSIDKLVYTDVPNDELWRINFLQELISTRQGELVVPGFTSEEISAIIENICVT